MRLFYLHHLFLPRLPLLLKSPCALRYIVLQMVLGFLPWVVWVRCIWILTYHCNSPNTMPQKAGRIVTFIWNRAPLHSMSSYGRMATMPRVTVHCALCTVFCCPYLPPTRARIHRYVCHTHTPSDQACLRVGTGNYCKFANQITY